MSTVSARFAELGVPSDLCARPRRCRDHRTVPHPVRRHPRRPRRPRRRRPRAHRLGQDARLRSAARRPAASGAASPAHRPRARPDPRAGRADHQRAAPVRAPAPPRRRVRVRRGGLRPAAQGPRRRRRARRGMPRPARGPDPVRSRVTRRRRPGRRRRGRPHGRHGLPPRGSAHPRADQRTTARCCCSPPRSTARCPSSPATSSATPCVHEIGPQGPDIAAARHIFWQVDRTERAAATADAIKAMGSTIVFCRTRHGADRLTRQLDKLGVTATPIHGGRSQPQRDRALRAFARGEVRSLIATDVAARGVHVDGVAGVVHFDPPQDAATYVHRSGRTARAGATGVVVSLVERSETHSARRLQREVGIDAAISHVDLDALDETPVPHRPRRPHQPHRGRARGVVKFFHGGRGYGFIDRGTGVDLFVHHSSLQRAHHCRSAPPSSSPSARDARARRRTTSRSWVLSSPTRSSRGRRRAERRPPRSRGPVPTHRTG